MTLPTLYLAHGGGPWPWMDGLMRDCHDGLARSLAGLPAHLPSQPVAVLLVTAHWEAPVFTISAGAAPGMLHDYYGFPPETYAVRYAAPGAPALARRAAELLASVGIEAALDTERGFDHGSFVPMFAMYPQAGMPVLQMSLRRGLDPAQHLAAGRALAPLRAEGVLIVGSGSSYHNMQERGPSAFAPSQAFDGWLQRVLAGPDPAGREAALLRWEEAPAARHAHPREEHLLPLMVAAGAAAGETGRCIFREERFFGISTVSSFCFGEWQDCPPPAMR